VQMKDSMVVTSMGSVEQTCQSGRWSCQRCTRQGTIQCPTCGQQHDLLAG
jgi:hypothetical protein